MNQTNAFHTARSLLTRTVVQAVSVMRLPNNLNITETLPNLKTRLTTSLNRGFGGSRYSNVSIVKKKKTGCFERLQENLYHLETA